MPFFNPLTKTAPGYDRNQRWPIDGTAYVAVFMGPISAGFFGGLFTPHWGAVLIGLWVGIGLAFLNGWLSDRFLDSWIALNQRTLQRAVFRILLTVSVFVWALLLSAASMLAPFVVFGCPLPHFIR